MPVLALGKRHDPRQGGETSKENKNIGETRILACSEVQLCQQNFFSNTCSEHRWEFSAGFAAGSSQFSVMTQDFQLLCRRRLLRPYSDRISIFHDKRPCLALLVLFLIKLILLTHSISEILCAVIMALKSCNHCLLAL